MIMILTVSLSGCDLFTPQRNIPIEMVAYNSLMDKEKDLIQVSPKDSTVEKIKVNQEIKSFIRSDYDKEHVYSVTFHQTDLKIFVDLDSATVVGKKHSK